MRATRILLNILLLLVTMVVETVWLSMLGLPGAIPPLTLVATLALARLRTARDAALIGFAVGLVLDLFPPSTTPAGVSAFTFAALAFAFSHWRSLMEGSSFLTMVGVAISAASAVVISTSVMALSSSSTGPLIDFLLRLLFSPLYAVLLATMVFPSVNFLNRLVTPTSKDRLFK